MAHPSNYLGVHRLLFDRFRQNAHVQRLKAASQYPRLHCHNPGLLLEVKIFEHDVQSQLTNEKQERLLFGIVLVELEIEDVV